MAISGLRGLLFVTAILLPCLGSFTQASNESIEQLNRSTFPPGFIFGTASSSYQYEGAAAEDGKGPSIWDTFTRVHPEKIHDRSNGSVALDSYHRYKEDVALVKEMGVDAYRLSISWPRILPKGSLKGGVNKPGIEFYNNVINEIVSNGLKPFITLFHWDLPQALEDQYGGFLSPLIINDYVDYVDICFKEFGDRVKHWITFNEPLIFSTKGYASGVFAPGRCTPHAAGNCTVGDSGMEPYIVSHHQLLSHACAVKLYRDKYKAAQKGEIGITHASYWFVPFSDSKSDLDAVARVLDFNYGWYMDPLTQGDYPFIMRALLQDRLPTFTPEQSQLIKGSFDFIGINYYTSAYAYNAPFSNSTSKSYYTDSFANTTAIRNGVPIGPSTATDWLYIYPKGIRDLVLYTKEKYNDPVIYITENGVDEANNETLPIKAALNDDIRVDYYKKHLHYLNEAIMRGAKVKGYFAWTLLDDFEWDCGYTIRFGIHYVDYKNGLKRLPKKSSLWFRSFLKRLE